MLDPLGPVDGVTAGPPCDGLAVPVLYQETTSTTCGLEDSSLWLSLRRHPEPPDYIAQNKYHG